MTNLGATTPSSLELHEGVLLGYALVDRAAEDACVRGVAIKGPVTEAHGLRSPRRSVDVDYLVEASSLDALRGVLEEAGWEFRINTGMDLIPHHSITMRHPFWPCELDLHHHFPGFLGDPDAVFAELWSRRTDVMIGGRAVRSADRVSMAAIAALHLLRDRDQRRADFDDLVKRVADLFTPLDLASLAELASATGSVQTLAPLFEGLGLTPPQPSSTPEGLEEWMVRSSTPRTPAFAWINAFWTTSVLRWPSLLRHALFLTDTEIRYAYPDLSPGYIGLWRGRIRRWIRGIRSMPDAIRQMGQVRRQKRASSGRPGGSEAGHQ